MSLRLRFFACIAPLLVLAGCSQPAQQEIIEVREPTLKREAPPKTTTEQRLGMAANSGTGAAAAGDEDPLAGITFHHDMPRGWEAVPKTDMRQVNLRMKETPEAECYFTLLPGGGGGLEANLNRWRGQMGLEPLSPEAIAALPKKTIFNQPATFILIDGTFSGMGDIEPRENYRMYGIMLSHTDPESGREQGFFLKMTGPKAVLENEEANFDLVATSLHAVAPGDNHTHDDDNHEHTEGDGHDHGAETPAAETAAPAMDKATPASSGEGSGYTWAVPAGWENKEPGMMRQANLTIAGQPDVECYLTELSGSAGGLESNINRWQQQMDQPALTPDQIAALPKQPLLGGEASYVVIDGTFGGMSATVMKENYRMYGLALVNDSVSHFVKMTGPKDLLVAEEANFLAFAASLSKGTAAPAPEATPMPEVTPAPQAAADNPHGVADPTPAGGFNPANIQWTAPEGWEQAPEKMMRVVTYTVGAVECYVTSLAGEAGGTVSNINRWANQMGQVPLDEAAIAALPKVTLLTQEIPLVEFAGDFVDMDGAPKPDYKMLGAMATADGTTIFIKLTGPASEVDAQKDKFIAFCASLH